MKDSPQLNKTNLTQSQLMIWTGQELNPEVPLYNVIMTYTFSGAIDVDQFSRAFTRLVTSSDAMRMVFFLEDGVPIQKVLNKPKGILQALDFSNDSNKTQRLRQWITDHNRQKFDLTQCAYYSALIKMDSDRYIWYLNQHHLITDAWGVTVQYHALKQFYFQPEQRDAQAIHNMPQFRDYMVHEIEQMQDVSFTETKRYWEEKIANTPPAVRLYGYTDQVLETASTRISIDLGVERTTRLKAIAGEAEFKSWTEHLSMYNLFATLLFAYLYRVTGQSNLAIGTPAHNRTKRSYKQTPGVFIQFFPLFIEVVEGLGFTELNQRVKQEVAEFMLHAVPGSNSVEANRSFQVILNYIHAELEDFNGTPMSSEWIHPEHSDANHHLRLQIHDFDNTGSLQLDFDLNNQLFNKTRQPLVAGHFLNLLDAFIEDHHQSISNPMLVSNEEFQQLIPENGHKQVRSSQTVLDLFQQQVDSRAKHIAIQCENQTMSYDELDKRSNQLAHYLMEHGVTRENQVVLFMSRSVELLVAIWGVLKTGASYVPLDASFPNERVASITADLNASVILTNGASGIFENWIQLDIKRDWQKLSYNLSLSPSKNPS